MSSVNAVKVISKLAITEYIDSDKVHFQLSSARPRRVPEYLNFHETIMSLENNPVSKTSLTQSELCHNSNSSLDLSSFMKFLLTVD